MVSHCLLPIRPNILKSFHFGPLNMTIKTAKTILNTNPRLLNAIFGMDIIGKELFLTILWILVAGKKIVDSAKNKVIRHG